jgi:ActR/RegA family two-component response regulator
MVYRAGLGGVRASAVRRRSGLRRVEASIVREGPVPLVVLEPARLLLVHEPTPLRASMEAGLGRAGFEVSTASDATEALDQLERAPVFDLALVDMDLYAPWSSRLIGALKTVDPGLFVAMLRGEGSREEFVEGYEAGASILLRMPSSLQELADQLRSRLPEARRIRSKYSAPERRKPRSRAWGWFAGAVLIGAFLGAAVDAFSPGPASDPLLDFLRSESERGWNVHRFQRWAVAEQLRLTQEAQYWNRIRESPTSP